MRRHLSLINIIFLLLLLLGMDLHAQKEGDTWVIGYYSLGGNNYSLMDLDFAELNLKIKWHYGINSRMHGTASNICDSEGKPLLWTNGMQIYAAPGKKIVDTIAFLDQEISYWTWFFTPPYGTFGFPEHDGAMILPVPETSNEYIVMYHSAEYVPNEYFQVTQILEARIRVVEENKYELIYKDKQIGPYLFEYKPTISATRHANGRDWWVIVFEGESPNYFSHLLDPTGLNEFYMGSTDGHVKEGHGQARFSPHGNFLARSDQDTFILGQFITLYSFDRCSGTLDRMHTFHAEEGFFNGLAFSPSERYLYANNNENLWQWDLWAENIPASQVLVDTFDGFVQPGWFVMRFGPMMTAPDGRIYVVPPAGSSEFMHVIDRPDLPAAECRFLQHHIDLKVPNGRSSPNIPNFRLGPLDGSPCDTLGLDNYPVARWRYEEDVPGWWYTIRFTDLSFYEPDTWHWDFDDGTTSDETSPVHTFEPGLYHVCLTVSNEYASDSSCRWVEILTTSLHEERSKEPDLSISPNPFSDELVITSRSGVFRTAHIRLYDVHGRMVLNEPTAPVPLTITLPELSPGVYLCVIEEKDGTVYSEKVVKQ